MNPPIPTLRDGQGLLVSTAMDVTFYPCRLGEAEFDVAVNAYRDLAPEGSWKLFMLRENRMWDSVEAPRLPAGLSAGNHPLGFLDVVRDRIRQHRPVEFRLWNQDADRPWSFSCYRQKIDGRARSLCRVVAPCDTNPRRLLAFLAQITRSVPSYSAHAGFCFTYDVLRPHSAFSEIFKYARRYWATNVEYLNLTLAQMDERLSGVHWLNYVGAPLLDALDREGLGALPSPTVVRDQDSGVMIQVTDEPTWGDRHKLGGELTPYFAVAQALEPLLIRDLAGEFPGTFSRDEVSVQYIRRFVEPNAWR